jgi:hypothetical protein
LTRRNRISAARLAWAIPLLIAVLALALPAVGEAAGTGSIEGTVTAEGGGALKGVEVCAEEVDEEAFECGTTGNTGTYLISGLPGGEYKVEFWSEGDYVRQFYNDKPSWETANPVQVMANTTRSGINAVLEAGATIKGVVTAAATGQPVAGVEVCAFSVTGGARCGESGGTGSYAIVGLGGVEFEVDFFAEGTGQGLLSEAYPLGLVTVPAHGEVSGINAALQPGGQITGTVRLAATNAPLAGVRVCLSEAEFLESLGCLTTPASGAYRFYGLWNSSYKVVFSAASNEIFDPTPIVDAYPTQWWNGRPTFATATPIPVTAPATVSGIDGSLGPPPAVPPTSSTTPPAAPAPATAVAATSKSGGAPKCRRGFAKRKVRGKQRCVKLHTAARHHRRGHKKSA